MVKDHGLLGTEITALSAMAHGTHLPWEAVVFYLLSLPELGLNARDSISVWTQMFIYSYLYYSFTSCEFYNTSS